jgi:hypothetical protein
MSTRRESAFTKGMDHHRSETGAVIVFVTLLLVFMLGMIGLAFDIGQAFANKSQLQNVADASALAGASALDGTAVGIIEAEHRATDAGGFLDNKMAFNTQAVPISPTEVTYSVMLDGPWLDRTNAEASAPTIRFVRTQLLNRPSPVFFGKLIPNVSNVLNLGVEAVAGQEPLSQVCRGLDPFSPAPIGGGGAPYFGYVPGTYYELRLSPGQSEIKGNGHDGCSDYGLGGCVTGNFGLADSGLCGVSMPCWADTIINGSMNACVQTGTGTLRATTGKAGKPVIDALLERYMQDNDKTEYYGAFTPGQWSAEFDLYQARTKLSAGGTPYRRIIRTAFNDGNIPSGAGYYNVQGFGCFWMVIEPHNHPPSDAVCMMFVGECDTSGTPTGTNPSITKLVLFR